MLRSSSDHKIVVYSNILVSYIDITLLRQLEATGTCVSYFQVGDLGSITAEDNGRAEFRVQSGNLKVWDVIGRSIVIHHTTDDKNVARR